MNFNFLFLSTQLNKEEFSKEFDLSRQSIYNYLSGKNEPSQLLINSIIDYNNRMNNEARRLITVNNTVVYSNDTDPRIVARAMLISGCYTPRLDVSGRLTTEIRRYMMTPEEVELVTSDCDTDDEKVAALSMFNEMLTQSGDRAEALARFILN